MPTQYRPQWTIPGAGASESVMNFNLGPMEPDELVAAVRSFFAASAGLLPNEVLINFPGELTELDTVTGDLVAVTPVTAPAPVVGTGTGGWAGGVGALVQWQTGVIFASRRQTGRTFMVPLTGASFATNGVLTAPTRTTLVGAAEALLATLAADLADLVVWSRAHGILSGAVSATIPDRSAILRERRDD